MSTAIATNHVAMEGISDIGYHAIRRLIGSGAAELARSTNQSYIQAASIARVEPICIIDQSLNGSPILGDILQTTLNTFSLFYLQATAIENAISNVKVFRALDRLSTNRSASRSILHNTIALESLHEYGNQYDFSGLGLPKQVKNIDFKQQQKETRRMHIAITEALGDSDFSNINPSFNRNEAGVWQHILATHKQSLTADTLDPNTINAMMTDYVIRRERLRPGDAETAFNIIRADNRYRKVREDLTLLVNRARDEQIRADNQANNERTGPRIGVVGWDRLSEDIINGIKTASTSWRTTSADTSGAYKAINEASDLAVGKLLHVDYCTPEGKVNVPISVRLMTHWMPPTMVAEMMSKSDRSLSLKERFHAARSGQIAWISDFVFNKDVRKGRVQFAIKDKSGAYAAIKNRTVGHRNATLLTANPSLGAMSNIVIMTKTALNDMEARIGGRFSNFRTREGLLEDTGLMIVVVVDTERSMVTYYYHDTEESTTYTFNELKSHRKKDKDDMTPMLMSFLQGSAPRF